MTSKLLADLQASLVSDIEQELEGDEYSDTFRVPDTSGSNQWVPTPKQIEIMSILRETPMLTDWCLRRLKELQARIAGATLDVMYTEDELTALRKQLAEELGA